MNGIPQAARTAGAIRAGASARMAANLENFRFSEFYA